MLRQLKDITGSLLPQAWYEFHPIFLGHSVYSRAHCKTATRAIEDSWTTFFSSAELQTANIFCS